MPDVKSIDLAIDLKSLTKVYGNGVQALDHLSMRVRRGEIYGLLGPNGAGKSTLIKCLTGLVHPTACRGTVLGYPVGDPEVNSQLGYLPENASWPEHLNAGQVLDFAGRLHGLPGRERRKRVTELLKLSGLEAWRDDRPQHFSKGMRQRLGVAYALMGNPDLVFLDEPTDGLDPNQKDVVRNLIKEMGKTKAIIFSTHILEEVEACCTRAVIIDQGKVVADGTPDELKRRALRAGSVTVKISGADLNGIAHDLEKLGHASRVDHPVTTGDSFTGVIFPKAKTATGALTAEIYELCRQKNLSLLELHEEPGRLDEMFRELTSQNKV